MLTGSKLHLQTVSTTFFVFCWKLQEKSTWMNFRIFILQKRKIRGKNSKWKLQYFLKMSSFYKNVLHITLWYNNELKRNHKTVYNFLRILPPKMVGCSIVKTKELKSTTETRFDVVKYSCCIWNLYPCYSKGKLFLRLNALNNMMTKIEIA